MKAKILSALLLVTSLSLVGCGSIEKSLEKADNYLDNHDYDKAISAYEKIIDKDDECDDAYEGLIKCYVKTGNMSSANKVYEDACDKLDKDDMKGIEKYIDKINSDAFIKLDRVHTAILTAMLDPAITYGDVNYNEKIERFSQNACDIRDIKYEGEDTFEGGILDILGLKDGEEFYEDFSVFGEDNPVVLFQIISPVKVDVWVEGHEDELCAD